MPELSLQHIDQISHDISREEISFSHLLEDLIDHVCCDVEYEMQKGKNFNDAYKTVKEKMGPRRIKEIQEETLYLVDTKYRNMKNTMKISGVAGTIMYGCSALFKIQHWPGAGILMSLGAIVLAFVFLPSALSVLWKETHNRKRLFLFLSAFFAGLFFITGTLWKIQHWPGAGILLSMAVFFGVIFFIPSLTISRIIDQKDKAKRPVYIFGALGFILYGIGMLFKIQHWPQASGLMVAGMIMLCAISFPWYTWLTWKQENHITPGFLFMIIGLLLIIVPGALINLNLQDSYKDGYYSNLDQQQNLFNYNYNYNKALVVKYRDSGSYTKMEQLHSVTDGLLSTVSNIQIKMVEQSEGKADIQTVDMALIKQTDNGPEIQYALLSNPFQIGIVNSFLMQNSNSREDFNKSVAGYLDYLSGLVSPECIVRYRKILDSSVYLIDPVPEIQPVSLLSGLHSLELFKNSLLTVERNVLTSLTSN
jgi:hypothetical protein